MIDTEDLLIGGLPSELFAGRRIKFWSLATKSHSTPGRLVEVLGNGQALVHPEGHKHTIKLQVRQINPWWARNDDLRQQAVPGTSQDAPAFVPPEHWWLPKEDATDAPHEDTIRTALDETAIPVTRTPIPIVTHKSNERRGYLPSPATPVPSPTPEEIPLIRHQRLMIGTQVRANWYDLYKAYASALEDKEAADAMVADAEKKCATALRMLSLAGVEVVNEEPEKVAKTSKPNSKPAKVSVKTVSNPKPAKKAKYVPKLTHKNQAILDKWFIGLGLGFNGPETLLVQDVIAAVDKKHTWTVRALLPQYLRHQGFVVVERKIQRPGKPDLSALDISTP